MVSTAPYIASARLNWHVAGALMTIENISTNSLNKMKLLFKAVILWRQISVGKPAGCFY
jgi:hypothetical protein